MIRVCNTYCADQLHAELVYIDAEDRESAHTVAWWAYRWRYGCDVVSVKPAHEYLPLDQLREQAARRPELRLDTMGFDPAADDAKAWLVKYREMEIYR